MGCNGSAHGLQRWRLWAATDPQSPHKASSINIFTAPPIRPVRPLKPLRHIYPLGKTENQLSPTMHDKRGINRGSRLAPLVGLPPKSKIWLPTKNLRLTAAPLPQGLQALCDYESTVLPNKTDTVSLSCSCIPASRRLLRTRLRTF